MKEFAFRMLLTAIVAAVATILLYSLTTGLSNPRPDPTPRKRPIFFGNVAPTAHKMDGVYQLLLDVKPKGGITYDKYNEVDN